MHLVGNLSGACRAGRSGSLPRGQRSFVPTLRNWVAAKLARKRMATQQALQSQPNSARRAETFDGFVGILRAGGMKPAVPREQEGQIRFVKPQRKKREAYGKLRGLRVTD